jgi:hypothetical protein
MPAYPDRRRFLTSSASALIAAHAADAERAPPNRPMADPRILGLELRSAAPLAVMKEFYRRTLGLLVLDDRSDRLTVAAGLTRLTFVTANPDHGKPFYHFAFNIPENKILAARRWQAERTPLLPIPAGLRDPNFPADVVNYSHWNAHSVFFFDPAGNVVEYIARHDLKNAAPGGFGPADVLYASEIAFVVDDVPAMAARLKEVAGVGQYRGGGADFMALGDETGLLLVMKRGRVISFDAADKKAVTVFHTAATVRGGRPGTHHLPAYPYELTVSSM